MRITLIVTWWIAVALTVAQFILNGRIGPGVDFYIHNLASFIIVAAGVVGLTSKLPTLFYGGFLALMMEWFRIMSFLSEILKLGENSGFSNPIFMIWVAKFLVISIIMIVGLMSLFQPKSSLNLSKYLLSVSPNNTGLIRNSTSIILGILGIFIYFTLRMQEFIVIHSDWIRITAFAITLILLIVGTTRSSYPLILCSFYVAFGVSIFCCYTTISYSFSVFVLLEQFGFSDAWASSYFYTFIFSLVYLVVSISVFLHAIFKLTTVEKTEQLDQF